MSASPGPYARNRPAEHMRGYPSAVHILVRIRRQRLLRMHRGYEEASALERQLEALAAGRCAEKKHRYLFDKQLHNDYRLKPERLGLPISDPRLWRSRAHAPSIVHLFRKSPTRTCSLTDRAATTTSSGAGAANLRTAAGLLLFRCGLLQRAPKRMLPRRTAGWSWIRP